MAKNEGDPMRDNPFLIFSPEDMLAKAKRDLVQLKREMNADTIFNFFVTAYHVMDYVKALGTVPPAAIDSMYDDPDFGLCRFICTRGKHLRVTTRPKKVRVKSVGGCLNRSALNEAAVNAGTDWAFYCDDDEVNPVELGETVIQKWERFFEENVIS